MADILLISFGFSWFAYVELASTLFDWLNPNQSNRRSAKQWYFPLWRVFSAVTCSTSFKVFLLFTRLGNVQQQLRVLRGRDHPHVRLLLWPHRHPPLHPRPPEGQPQKFVLDPSCRTGGVRCQLPRLRRPHHRLAKGLGMVSTKSMWPDAIIKSNTNSTKAALKVTIVVLWPT